MKGNYLLHVSLPASATISIGKLGFLSFDTGEYVYVGSAMNGLHARLRRHCRIQKKHHWHIDYLLSPAQIKRIYVIETQQSRECQIAATISKHLTEIPGFGCSDCSCKSHLFFGTANQITTLAKQLDMKQYTPSMKND